MEIVNKTKFLCQEFNEDTDNQDGDRGLVPEYEHRWHRVSGFSYFSCIHDCFSASLNHLKLYFKLVHIYLVLKTQ